MVFYLGKDVGVTFNTESSVVTAAGLSPNESTGVMALVTADSATLANYLAGTPVSQGDLTSVDISIGAMDEDITYFGLRTALKAEIKKETTITLTRKKSNSFYDIMFDQARYGVKSNGAAVSPTGEIADGLEVPTKEYGYRVVLTLKGSQEVMTIPNCVVASHGVTIAADGTTEETLELMSYVTPIIKNAGDFSVTNPLDL